MSKPYKLLVFDWDGTLMDSPARIVNCFKAAADDVSLPALDEAAIREVIGIGLWDAVSHMYPEADTPQLEALIERYRHYDGGADQTPAELFDGVEPMLRQLEAMGYFLGVATSKGRRGLDRVLARTGLGDVFHATRCVDEAFSKPHPQMLLAVMELVGAEPQETLMIGDTAFDMQMAANAGAHGLAVACGVHDHGRLMACGPQGCLTTTTELPAWLAQHDS